MQQDLLSADELLGDIDSFTVEQRTARETFIEQELHLPREWLCEDGILDASPAGLVATGIYNSVVESGAADPRFPNWEDGWQATTSFAGIIKGGADALLWSLIRIGLKKRATSISRNSARAAGSSSDCPAAGSCLSRRRRSIERWELRARVRSIKRLVGRAEVGRSHPVVGAP